MKNGESREIVLPLQDLPARAGRTGSVGESAQSDENSTQRPLPRHNTLEWLSAFVKFLIVSRAFKYTTLGTTDFALNTIN